MLRHSLSFLQVAKSVSEVANSRYQSLFFILGGEGGARRGGDMGTCGGGVAGMQPGDSTHLLLNFSGYFSRMTWKRCAMEASCGWGGGRWAQSVEG